MTILVSGANGTTGNAVLHALVDQGEQVRALVRDRSRLHAPDGLEVVEGDFNDGASLDRALVGVDAAYLVDVASPTQGAEESAFVDAAVRSGVERLVLLSVVGADQPGMDAMRLGAGHVAGEAAVVASGLAYTLLRPNGFLQNNLNNAGSISATNAFYSPLSPAARVSYVDVVDIAAVAAAALTQAGHEGKAYVLTGPEGLNDDEVAERFSRVLGREIAHVQVPIDVAQSAMRDGGLDDWYVEALSELFAFYETGHAAGVSTDVEQVLGRTARTIDQFIEDHRAAFGG